jgi:hypothetical protein
MTTVSFIKDFTHFIGNGTKVFYAAGDTAELDQSLAFSLVHEGMANIVPTPDTDTAEDRETKVISPEETKPTKKGKR